MPCKRGNDPFEKVVAHNCEYETFCYKFHIWLDKRFQKYIGNLAVMLATLIMIIKKKQGHKEIEFDQDQQIMHVTPKIKIDQKKRLYS